MRDDGMAPGPCAEGVAAGAGAEARAAPAAAAAALRGAGDRGVAVLLGGAGNPAGGCWRPRCRIWCRACAGSRNFEIDDAAAAQLLRIAPATIDRRLKPDRAKLEPRGRSHTKPGTLLKDSIPMRTWAEWDDAVPGFVEIDLVGHEGGKGRASFVSPLISLTSPRAGPKRGRSGTRPRNGCLLPSRTPPLRSRSRSWASIR